MNRDEVRRLENLEPETPAAGAAALPSVEQMIAAGAATNANPNPQGVSNGN